MAPQPGAHSVIPVSLLHKNPPSHAPRGPKAAQPRLKLICRRLPPGLTQPEFEAVLGAEWKVGTGRVDWLSFRKGKISTDAAKPSRPARAYLHVTKQDHVRPLGDYIRAASFHDAAKSWQDPALLGPPTLEYAPYPKMPGGRRRHDNRQGTIDQDAEFKDFLESLTNPITKPAAPDSHAVKEKVKTTPLIEALREKKANRDKPNSKTSRQSRAEAKEDGSDKNSLAKSGRENTIGSGDKIRRPNKGEKTQAAVKEAVKIANSQSSVSRSVGPAATGDKSSASSAPERKRGNAATVKSLVQRDLGVGPAPNRRRGTKREVGSAAPVVSPRVKETGSTDDKSKEKLTAQSSVAPIPSSSATADKPAASVHKKERPTRAERRAFKAGAIDKSTDKAASAGDTKGHTSAKSPAPQILKKPQGSIASKVPATSRGPPTEPAAARSNAKPIVTSPKSEAPSVPMNAPPLRPTPSSPAPGLTSKQAFLKHANSSQGITEILIEEAMKAFGGIEKVEIDKRKGFAYVDFAEPTGLQKAMAASPITIAQGAIQVLERKEKISRAPRFITLPTGPARGGHAGRGGFASRGRGRGGTRGVGNAGASSSKTGDSSTPTVTASPAATPVVT